MRIQEKSDKIIYDENEKIRLRVKNAKLQIKSILMEKRSEMDSKVSTPRNVREGKAA